MFVAGSLLLALMLPTLPALADEATTVAQARVALRVHDYAGAIAVLDKEIAAGSGSPEVYSLRCLARGQIHRFDDALTDCNHAVQLDATYIEAYKNRGNLYLDAGFPSKSLPDFNTYLAAQADDVNVLWSRCDARRLTKDIPGATADCKRASEIMPDAPQIRISLGRLDLIAKNYDDAYAAFNYAVTSNPTDVVALYWRGFTSLQQGAYRKAVDDFTAAIAAGDTAAETYANRGRAFHDLGDDVAGKKDMDTAIATALQHGLCDDANTWAVEEAVLFKVHTIQMTMCPK